MIPEDEPDGDSDDDISEIAAPPAGTAGAAPPREPRPLQLGWLALAPATSLAEVLVFPRLPVASEPVALAVASAGAVVPALGALALASRANARTWWLASIAAMGALGIVALYLHGISALGWLPVATAAIVAFGGGLGMLIGSRVQHAGHVLPAAFVAAAADVASVLHPSGPSNAIAGSARALSALAVGAPVPGADGVAFTLGVGDLVFSALLFAVAVSRGASLARTGAGVALGVALAIVLSAVLARPIPALVTIGACTVLLEPAFRQVRRADRRVTEIAIVLAIGAAGIMIARTLLGSS